MYVIRRKSDGKFWRNRGYGISNGWSCSSDEAKWTSDIDEVKPFFTVSAAKNSRGWSKGRFTLPRPENTAPHSEWTAYLASFTKWTDEENKNEVVRVVISLA